MLIRQGRVRPGLCRSGAPRGALSVPREASWRGGYVAARKAGTGEPAVDAGPLRLRPP